MTSSVSSEASTCLCAHPNLLTEHHRTAEVGAGHKHRTGDLSLSHLMRNGVFSLEKQAEMAATCKSLLLSGYHLRMPPTLPQFHRHFIIPDQ